MVFSVRPVHGYVYTRHALTVELRTKWMIRRKKSSVWETTVYTGEESRAMVGEGTLWPQNISDRLLSERRKTSAIYHSGRSYKNLLVFILMYKPSL